MAFFGSKRKVRQREENEVGELNIVPYFDVLMNLILFVLLSMAGLSTFGSLNVSAALDAVRETPAHQPLFPDVTLAAF